MEHAKTVEALNKSEAEQSAFKQKLEVALRDMENAEASLVRPVTTLSIDNVFPYNTQMTITPAISKIEIKPANVELHHRTNLRVLDTLMTGIPLILSVYGYDQF